MNADKLLAFRQTAYKYLGRVHDALFELGDAVLSRPRWFQMHFRTTAKHPLQLILVERLDEAGHRRAWVGETMPPLNQIWQLYCRRLSVDPWFRFAKPRLHWTLPNLSTAKQAERWSDLMPLLSSPNLCLNV